jgi:hypothetical protein
VLNRERSTKRRSEFEVQPYLVAGLTCTAHTV